MQGWTDITVPLRTGMVVWPDDLPVRVQRTHGLDLGDSMNLSGIMMSLHAGTHMDAPLHFIGGGAPIDRMPFDATIGRARVIGLGDLDSVRRGERVLFKTTNSARCWQTDEFVEDYERLTPEAAKRLARRRVRCVGIDYLSIGDEETHRILLGAGVWIIEGLNLAAIEPGKYELICLPLRVLGSEGAPARAIVRRV